MVRWNRLVKVGRLVFISILVGVYVFIWEPYCFFETVYHTEGVELLQKTSIYNPTPERNISTNKDLIVILVPSLTTRFLSRLQLIDRRFIDNFVTPILIMHNKPLLHKRLRNVAKMIQRPILFLDVGNAFRIFPPGFDPCREKTSYRVRGKWNYLLMIRFWFKFIFELPQLKEYEYLMRLDDDSQLKNRWFNVFDEMRRKKAVYFANNVDVDLEEQLPGTMLVQNVTANYIERNDIIVKQSEMLRRAFNNNTVLNYYNNFEVVQLEFFRSPEVLRWIKAIDQTNGIFKYRWGDAVLRYLTLAIFAEKQQVLHRTDYNLSYCHKC